MTPSYALGLLFIFLVSIIWSAASIVVQHLYHDMDFHSPFLLTYIGTSLFVVFIPIRLLWERRLILWRSACCVIFGRRKNNGGWKRVSQSEDEEEDYDEEGTDVLVIPWMNKDPERGGYLDVPSAASSIIHPTGIVEDKNGENVTGNSEEEEEGETSGGEGGIEMELCSDRLSKESTRETDKVRSSTADVLTRNSPLRHSSSSALHRQSGPNQEKTTLKDISWQKKKKCFNDSNAPDIAKMSTNSFSGSNGDKPQREDSSSSFSSDQPQGNENNKDKGGIGEVDDDTLILCSPLETEQSSPAALLLSTPAFEMQKLHLLSHVDHISIALRIAPVWFVSNYFYNTSLAYTSITSSTVLASTGSLFTFLFAVCCGDESFTKWKASGVIFCVLGSVMTGLSDVNHGNNSSGGASDNGGNNENAWNETLGLMLEKNDATSSRESSVNMLTPPHHHTGGSGTGFDDNENVLQIWGDIAGLVSAVGYGTYTVLIRTLCPKDEDRMSMQLLLGYIGAFNMLILCPVAIKCIFFGTHGGSSYGQDDDTSTPTDPADQQPQYQDQLTWVIFVYLVLKGLFDNVLSDYLWARAVVLTSATVATVGLGLTIPLAFVSDWIMGRKDVTSLQSVTGALAVLAGFVFVNVGGDTGEEAV